MSNWRAGIRVTLGKSHIIHNFELDTGTPSLTDATRRLERAIFMFGRMGVTVDIVHLATTTYAQDGSEEAEKRRNESLMALARCVLGEIAKQPTGDDE